MKWGYEDALLTIHAARWSWWSPMLPGANLNNRSFIEAQFLFNTSSIRAAVWRKDSSSTLRASSSNLCSGNCWIWFGFRFTFRYIGGTGHPRLRRNVPRLQRRNKYIRLQTKWTINFQILNVFPCRYSPWENKYYELSCMFSSIFRYEIVWIGFSLSYTHGLIIHNKISNVIKICLFLILTLNIEMIAINIQQKAPTSHLMFLTISWAVCLKHWLAQFMKLKLSDSFAIWSLCLLPHLLISTYLPNLISKNFYNNKYGTLSLYH